MQGSIGREEVKPSFQLLSTSQGGATLTQKSTLRPSSFSFQDYLQKGSDLSKTAFEALCISSAAGLESVNSAESAQNGKVPIEKVRLPLDGFLLLDACNVEFPEEATSAVLCDKAIDNVLVEDMSFFKHLAYLDVGNNNIAIENLVGLVSLEELRIHCNGIRSIPCWTPEAKPFPMLVTLDLSYNGLCGKNLVGLTTLTSLRTLDLSYNGTKDIPSEFSHFPKLETLNLENNKIGSFESVIHLSNIKRLRKLNMGDNLVKHIPHPVQFKQLEWFNLANNLIEKQENIVSLLVRAENLNQLVLYGNPIATGHSRSQTQEQTKIDAEVLVPVEEELPLNRIDFDDDVSAHYLQHRKVVNLVTDPPANWRKKKKSNRFAYSQYQIATVVESQVKTPSQWKNLGNSYLKASTSETRISKGRDECISASSFRKDEKSAELLTTDNSRKLSKSRAGGFFMTDPGLVYEDGLSDEGEDETSECKAKDNNSQELKPKVMSVSELRRRLNLPFSKGKHKPDPAKLRSAVNRLRYILRNPLSLSGDMNGLDITEKRHYEKNTKAFESTMKKTKPYVPKPSRYARQYQHIKESTSNNSRENSTLIAIESVLDQLMNDKDGFDQKLLIHPLEEKFESISATEEANKAISNLIATVNEVMETFDP